MNLRRLLFIGTIWVIIGIFALPLGALAQVKVIISGGFSAPYRDLLPEFERTSGITVTTTSGGSQGSGPNTIEAQLRRGVLADVVILNKAGLADLVLQGMIVSGTEVDLAQTPLALAVRSGAAKPDISTVESFTQTLLRARSVTFTSSTTGIYLTTKLFPRLGIAGELARKSTTDGVAAVARGDAEMAIQALSELLPVTGIEVVGPIPPEVQNVAVFSAAVVKGSKEIETSKRLIAFLSSTSATATIRKSGMEPATPRWSLGSAIHINDVAGEPSSNCAANLPVDGGYNLEDGSSWQFLATNHSLSDTNPILAPLANNGGPTLCAFDRQPSDRQDSTWSKRLWQSCQYGPARCVRDR